MGKDPENIFERRKRWDAAHPYASRGVVGISARQLKENLMYHMRVVKKEDDSDIAVRQMMKWDSSVREWGEEIDLRLSEDNEITRHLSPLLKKAGDAAWVLVSKEIKDFDLQHEIDGASIILPTGARDEEGPGDALQNRVNSELQRKMGLKPGVKIRVGNKEYTTSDELDVEPKTVEPSGKIKDVTGQAYNEIAVAAAKIIPIDSVITARARKRAKTRRDMEDDIDGGI